MIGRLNHVAIAVPDLDADDMVLKLAEHATNWLAAPYEDSSSGMTAAELIESERRRMPLTGNASHLIDDCPLCQAQASGEFGPMFMCFDRHHLELEDEFAFSLYPFSRYPAADVDVGHPLVENGFRCYHEVGIC